MKIEVLSPGASGLDVGVHTIAGPRSIIHSRIEADVANGVTVVLPNAPVAPVLTPAEVVKEPEVKVVVSEPVAKPVPDAFTTKKAAVMPDYAGMSYNALRTAAAAAEIVLPRTADKEKYVSAFEKKWKKDNA